ncbi:hypothetical protein M408DRAFT_25491 [Serendipita vermifera MAFF 305830]|uniref:CASTOR ACT domain-containing protein n=1 Tax=Serendipita vermifera MAFF 305830 TaxID=933852 RepID=A0A0C3B468_SERVB|nr:hypothetical protein M408DRAFT_25491 [Serendipita vermifera MAFF 305830]
MWTALSLDVSRSPARLCTISDAMQSASIPMVYQSSMNCDYLFVPSTQLQKALSILENDIGLVVSEDECSDRYANQRWEKSRSRKSKRRSRRQQDVPFNSPSSSSTSSSDDSSSHRRGRPKIQKAETPSVMPPIRILPHKIAFHGLNSGMNGDALLKLVKMIGWPDSLLPSRPKYSPSDSHFGSYENRLPHNFPHQPAATNGNGPPRRPGLVTRHSADAQKFEATPGARLSDARVHGNGIPIQMSRLAPPAPRSRSTSYPEVRPDFHQYRNAAHRISTLPSPPEHPFAGEDPNTGPESQPLSQAQLHMKTLPFFSLTHRARDSGDTEVSVMTRGTLLSRLFESSMLIGGSGDIAVSDEDEDGYTLRGRRNHVATALDEGFKCLQIEFDSLKAGMFDLLPG